MDNDGKEMIVDKSNFARSCQCCCFAHCKQTAGHKIAAGISLTKYIATPTALEMRYTREKTLPSDSLIRPAFAIESVDKMYETLTALETNFTIE